MTNPTSILRKFHGPLSWIVIIAVLVLSSCSVSYTLNGSPINYDKYKTIRITDFKNQTPYNPTLAQTFNTKLRDRFIQQTRLKPVDANANIELGGEITGYNVQGEAIKEDSYSSMTRITVTINVRYVDNVLQGKNMETSFSAYREFSSSQTLESVQDQLCGEIVNDLVDEIYNSTVGNW